MHFEFPLEPYLNPQRLTHVIRSLIFISVLGVVDAKGQVTGTGLISNSQVSSISSVVDPYTVSGKVVNGTSGAGVPRALVTLSSRHVLTDGQGNFQFPGYTLSRGALNTSKPGYSNTPDGSPVTRLLGSQDLSVPLALKLYPNPILSGVVTGRDGLPISGVQIRLFMAASDINGMRWNVVDASATDTHGEYRFNPTPGNYRVSVGYTPRTNETGEMVMPVSFPEISSTDKSNYFALAPGQERRIDLQPRTGTPYPVSLHIESPSIRGVRFTVTDSAGESFSTAANAGDDPADFRLFLPTGSFTIRGHMDAQEVSQEGSARVTVTAKGAAATLQLAPLTNITVEVAVNQASTNVATATSSVISNQQPTARQFNLTLKNDKNIGDGVNADVALIGGSANVPFTFRVPPGRYRLQGNQGGTWHVESATYGQTNLLTNELVVAQGSGGGTIRVVVDNRTGTLQGTVHLPATVATAWVYLIPQIQTLAAISPIYISSTGSFTARPPVGTYNVVAVDHLLRGDLRDPDAAKDFSTAMKSVEITSGGQVTLDLNLAEDRKKGGE